MNSISEECQELKKAYDECFNEWFSSSFLKGERSQPCPKLFKSYQECVKKAVLDKKIELWEIEKDVLGTSEEKVPPK